MKLVSAAIAAVFSLGLAGSALAQEEAAPAGGAAAAAEHAAHHPRSIRRGAMPAGSMRDVERMLKRMGIYGAHHSTGTLTHVNHHTGIITVKTPQGTFKTYFPPSSVRRLKVGDTITIHQGYSMGTHRALMERMQRDRMGPGMHGQMGQGMGGQGGMHGGQMGQGMGGQGGMHGGGKMEQGMNGQGAMSGDSGGSR